MRIALDEIADPLVRESVLSFVADGCPSRCGIIDVHSPQQTYGQCHKVSEALAACLRAAGVNAWLPLGSSEVGWYGPQPELLGYHDRLNVGCSNHYWTVAATPLGVWAIDLTAAQYGYAGPLAYAGDGTELWAAQDEVATLRRLSPDQVRANRLAAGLAEHLLDADALDVHVDAQGRVSVCDQLPYIAVNWKQAA
jgi:hypothetical protein